MSGDQQHPSGRILLESGVPSSVNWQVEIPIDNLVGLEPIDLTQVPCDTIEPIQDDPTQLLEIQPLYQEEPEIVGDVKNERERDSWTPTPTDIERYRQDQLITEELTWTSTNHATVCCKCSSRETEEDSESDEGGRREEEPEPQPESRSNVRPAYRFNETLGRDEMRSPSPPFSAPAGYRSPWNDPFLTLPPIRSLNDFITSRENDIRSYYADIMDRYHRYRRTSIRRLLSAHRSAAEAQLRRLERAETNRRRMEGGEKAAATTSVEEEIEDAMQEF